VNKTTPKIYCAGPLFNPKEREEMGMIASTLRNAGYSVFLPQEDGLEFAKLFPLLIEKVELSQFAGRILNMAIFSLDLYQIINSDGLVVNLNGRVPDEGAMVEAGIAWSHNKALVIFKNDDRSLIQGHCNPMVMGLCHFQFVDECSDIPKAFATKFAKLPGKPNRSPQQPSLEATIANGRRISSLLLEQTSSSEITELLITLFGALVCKNEKNPTNTLPQVNSPQNKPKAVLSC